MTWRKTKEVLVVGRMNDSFQMASNGQKNHKALVGDGVQLETFACGHENLVWIQAPETGSEAVTLISLSYYCTFPESGVLRAPPCTQHFNHLL